MKITGLFLVCVSKLIVYKLSESFLRTDAENAFSPGSCMPPKGHTCVLFVVNPADVGVRFWGWG